MLTEEGGLVVEKSGPRAKGDAESSSAPVLDRDAALEMLRGQGDEEAPRDSSVRSSSSAYNPTVPLSAIKLPISRDEERPPPKGSKIPLIILVLALLFVLAAVVTIAGFYLT